LDDEALLTAMCQWLQGRSEVFYQTLLHQTGKKDGDYTEKELCLQQCYSEVP